MTKLDKRIITECETCCVFWDIEYGGPKPETMCTKGHLVSTYEELKPRIDDNLTHNIVSHHD